MTATRADVGVFGGSGFYEFVDDVEEIEVQTPYGASSATPTVGTVEGVRVAFIPRHGRDHELPPHRIPYRANVWAMHELGVQRIIGPNACGSLRADLAVGEFVGPRRHDGESQNRTEQDQSRPGKQRAMSPVGRPAHPGLSPDWLHIGTPLLPFRLRHPDSTTNQSIRRLRARCAPCSLHGERKTPCFRWTRRGGITSVASILIRTVERKV